jgi:hypothetical protein
MWTELQFYVVINVMGVLKSLTSFLPVLIRNILNQCTFTFFAVNVMLCFQYSSSKVILFWDSYMLMQFNVLTSDCPSIWIQITMLLNMQHVLFDL